VEPETNSPDRRQLLSPEGGCELFS